MKINTIFIIIVSLSFLSLFWYFLNPHLIVLFWIGVIGMIIALLIAFFAKEEKEIEKDDEEE